MWTRKTQQSTGSYGSFDSPSPVTHKRAPFYGRAERHIESPGDSRVELMLNSTPRRASVGIFDRRSEFV
jgi:hypothetical protein